MRPPWGRCQDSRVFRKRVESLRHAALVVPSYWLRFSLVDTGLPTGGKRSHNESTTRPMRSAFSSRFSVFWSRARCNVRVHSALRTSVEFRHQPESRLGTDSRIGSQVSRHPSASGRVPAPSQAGNLAALRSARRRRFAASKRPAPSRLSRRSIRGPAGRRENRR
jgi:hypothetical protein